MTSMAQSESAAAVAELNRQRHESDLYIRPGWVDADVALDQLNQGKANGDHNILWIRGRIQRQLRTLGHILDIHAGKFLFVSVLAIATFSVGLKSITFHSDVQLLWAEQSSSTTETSPPEMLSTHQMVIQTSYDPDVNLLHPRGLLEHLKLLQKATQVTINMFDITWRLKDFCQTPSIPNFDAHYIEQMFESMMPCSIITALDCFWEGSKLLGPDYPVYIPYGVGDKVKWTNLNPIEIVSEMKQKASNFDYHSLEDYLKRAGITSGYQEKPCLDPLDPECPITASNYNSTQNLDIGAELTSGCYGFAAKYMHWPEDLIVGGVLKNKSGHIKQAKALQTVVQLMGEHELFEYWSGHYRVHHIGWNQEKATIVLNAWQKKFAQEVERLTKTNNSSSPYLFVTFSTANLNEILHNYSKTDFYKLGIVLGVAAFYCWITKSGLAAVGVIVLASSSLAALGVCSLIGLPINLLSTHVLPFITVGLSMREMFLLLSSHVRTLSPSDLLQRNGPTIIITAFINSGVFLIAAILPVPALRVFCLQCSILVIFHNTALLIVFPSLLALEQRCRKADVPCFRNNTKTKTTNTNTINNNNNTNNNNNNNNNNHDLEHGINLLNMETICHQQKSFLTWIVSNYLTSIIFKPFVKVLFCLIYTILIIYCVFNGFKLEFDVRLSTFLPKNTQEYKYLEAQNKFFGFYNFYLVTTELEYPDIQENLYEYHNSLTKVPNVLKDSNGGLNMNDFWLANFRDFLLDLQKEFDLNRLNNCVNSEKWYNNATEKAVLAFKLLAQTGIIEYPVDKSQIFKKKLVNNNGIIDSKAFYNYLSVWNSNDQISYSSCHANLTPKPFQYYSSKTEFDLRIPKSQPLIYTQMPFYLKNLKTTKKILEILKQIKDITQYYNDKGLKNYPIGLIFSYFNQFLQFERLLFIQLFITIIFTIIILCFIIKWTKLLLPIINIIICTLFLTIININALTGTIGSIHFIIICRNIILIFSGYLNVLGNRERRLKLTINLYAESIIKGDIGFIICTIILIISKFEFIQYYIFTTLLISILISILNSLIILPILLHIIGPKSELYQLEHYDRISTPTPIHIQTLPKILPIKNHHTKTQSLSSSSSSTTSHHHHQTQSSSQSTHHPSQSSSSSSSSSLPTPTSSCSSSSSSSSRRNLSSKATREPSLTTITEESCNQSIIVEPQVTVEYSSPESSSSGPYTTKVTATANIKVELVTPVYRQHKCNKCYRKKCNRCRQQCRCCKIDSDSSDSSSPERTNHSTNITIS